MVACLMVFLCFLSADLQSLGMGAIAEIVHRKDPALEAEHKAWRSIITVELGHPFPLM